MPRRRTSQDPLDAVFDFHPYRATFRLGAPVIRDGWRAFDQPGGEGVPHPGVAALLGIPGVQIVTLHRDRVILLRDPDSAWERILPEARGILEAHFLGRPAWRAGDESEGAGKPAAA